MQFLNSLLMTSSFILFIIHHCQGNGDELGDDSLCTNVELYGEGNICFFAYSDDVSAANMTQYSSGNAQQFLKGVLHNYRFDFAYRNPSCVTTTIVKEKGKEVWGFTYLFNTKHYQEEFLPMCTMDGEERKMRNVKVSIEVTMNGENVNIDCNTVMAINPPAKEKTLPTKRQPPEGTKAQYVEIFTAAGFPKEYIEEISRFPERSCEGGDEDGSEGEGESEGKGKDEDKGKNEGEGEGEGKGKDEGKGNGKGKSDSENKGNGKSGGEE